MDLALGEFPKLGATYRTPKTVVYDTPIHPLRRKLTTAENSANFPVEFVAKLSAIKYGSKIYPTHDF